LIARRLLNIFDPAWHATDEKTGSEPKNAAEPAGWRPSATSSRACAAC
jgi:hypothetical protein